MKGLSQTGIWAGLKMGGCVVCVCELDCSVASFGTAFVVALQENITPNKLSNNTFQEILSGEL
eukprot:3444919-Amphidinium_carterae.2